MAVEDAHRLNKRVHCHANAAEALRNCIEAGVDVLEHCNWVGIEEGTIDYDHDAATLAGKKGLFAGINCPAPSTLLSRRDGRNQDWGEMTRWDLARRMQEAGVRVSINTDAGGEGLDRLPLYMPQMVQEDRATASEVIQMTTMIPAQAIGMGNQLGTLDKGKLADFLVLSKNPLDDMSTLASPLLVVKEGQIAAKDGAVIF
jgi:imidazolonepropionase-like amidohydrolase